MTKNYTKYRKLFLLMTIYIFSNILQTDKPTVNWTHYYTSSPDYNYCYKKDYYAESNYYYYNNYYAENDHYSENNYDKYLQNTHNKLTKSKNGNRNTSTKLKKLQFNKGR